MPLLYISLGANTGSRAATLRQALEALDRRLGRRVGCSSFYETEPVGFVSPHKFLNAAAAYETELTPRQLLRATQEVERLLGRTSKSRDGRYADRPIDIDLLMLDGVVVSEPDLCLPHPAMAGRRFVLEPLAEIAPAALHPTEGVTVAELLRRLNRPRIDRAAAPTEELLAAVNRLLPQLSAKARPIDAAALAALLARETTHLYTVADEQGTLCGMATLCLCSSPTSTKAWLEDVVVDASCRGRGYARALVGHIIKEAARLGAAALCLTSRPARRAANALYVSMGFERRETNAYQLTIDN